MSASSSSTAAPAATGGATLQLGAIESGDILVKYREDSGAVGTAIKAGQSLSGKGGDANFIHAGIAVAPTGAHTKAAASIIEMDGQGLQENALSTTGQGHLYDVFRFNENAAAKRDGTRSIAIGAAETARMIREGVAAQKNFVVTYDLLGAIRSLWASAPSRNSDRINALLDRLLKGDRGRFFCSGFVVTCYLVALEQSGILGTWAGGVSPVFPQDDVYYSPAALHRHLSATPARFAFLGQLRA